MSDKEFVRVREVMNSLDVSYATVQRWIRAGRLDAIRLPSGQFRVAKRALDAIRYGRTDVHCAPLGDGDIYSYCPNKETHQSGHNC